ncbi:MAG: hypothetical protein H7101_13815 [Deinococcales bacterium]|nr:hypothetical protein [Chitinophagaceae bacterium]
MKKIIVLAAATLIMSSTFANDCGKDKKCGKDKACCKKTDKATAKTTAKLTTKKA